MRIRVNFERPFETSYIGHLDLKTAMERGLRRTMLPLKYTEGFNKRVKLEMGFPLNVGMVGEDEYFDFYLQETVPLDLLTKRLSESFQGIINIKEARHISDKLPPISSYDAKLVNFVYAELTEDYPEELIEKEVKHIRESKEILVMRDGKEHNVRDFIERVELLKKEFLDLEILFSVFYTSHGSMRVNELETLLKESGVPINFKFTVRKKTSLLSSGKIITPFDVTA
ncbi:MAG: TIGR03936 family radical SAM-associated protein [Caldisericaceae bacterium]